MKSVSGHLARVIVAAAESSVGAAEAGNIAIVFRWLSDFLARMDNDVVTASLSDLTAFCEQRARSRSDRSMARLISILRIIFRMAVNQGLRADDPALLLLRPTNVAVAPNFSIKRTDIDALISWQCHRVQQPIGSTYFFELRRLVLACLLAAGITVAELVHLDVADRSTNGVTVGRDGARERFVRLDDEASAALSKWLEHRSSIPFGDGAMFPISRPPWSRLQLKSICKIISQLIEDAGPLYSHLTPATPHRSLYAAIVEDSLGWGLAIDAGGRKSMPLSCAGHRPLKSLRRCWSASIPLVRTLM